MQRSVFVSAPEEFKRSVLFAVELIDPVTREIVFRGVRVIAAGLSGKPIINRSGRFVWLREGDVRPSSITVDPGRESYAPATVSAPQFPADLDDATEAQRLLRIQLIPARAYVFPDGITAVRGRLLLTEGGSPIAQAEVQLQWFDDESQRWIPAPVMATTDTDGEFAVFVRLLPNPPLRPDIEKGFLLTRLHFLRYGEARKTPPDFEFLGPGRQPKGRIAEGQVLRRYLSLTWDELQSV